VLAHKTCVRLTNFNRCLPLCG